MFTSMSKDAASGIAPLLSGLGLALLFYTFMNINQRWQNSMVGIVSLVMLLQAMGNKSSFVMGFIFSAARSITKGKVPTFIAVTRFLSGEGTPALAERFTRVLSYGTVVPLIAAGIAVWIKRKNPALFLAGFLMFAFSALGPATGNFDLIFLIGMFGEVFMVLFFLIFGKTDR